MSHDPFFIVGCPRSGTTLLQMLLDAHPKLVIPPESLIFARFAEIFALYGSLDQASHLERLTWDLLHDARIKRWGLNIRASDFRRRIKEPSLRHVISALFDLYAEKEKKSRWGDKTPEHVYFLKEIKTLFPEAKIIHMVRDGRDVAVSLMRVFFGPNTIDRAAQSWKKHIQAYLDFRPSLKEEDTIEVYYENLVREAGPEVKRICQFLGEEEMMWEEQIPATQRKEHYVQYDAIHASLENPISADKINIFKRCLSRRQIEIFESIAGDLLEHYGYERATQGHYPLQPGEKAVFAIKDQFLRFVKKWGKWAYVKERIQYHLRKRKMFFFARIRECLSKKPVPTALLLLLVLTSENFVAETDAAQVGIKYNRAKKEYAETVLKDFERFQRDRIRTVMIGLPWSQWEPSQGELDTQFISGKLEKVLDYAAQHDMKIVLSSHCSFWGSKGNRTLPRWLQSKPGFESSTSALTQPLIRAYHISFLQRLIASTKHHPSVAGYSILNEPVAATKFFLTKSRKEFDLRWEGTLEIVQKVHEYKERTGVSQYLMIGQHGADTGYEAYVWKNTGRFDLTLFWTEWLDKLSAQGLAILKESERWYPGRPKVRTEGVLTFALLKASQKEDDFALAKTQWSESKDYGAAVYDYDAIYEYEGAGNASIPDLEAFYSWRIGSADGSQGHLLFLDHRHGDRPTPYYFALRDLASGIDSFEAFSTQALPANRKQTLLFNPEVAQAGVSKFWKGSGRISGQKENLPPGVESNIAAEIALKKGQNVLRTVISDHWRDNGVKESNSFYFWAYSREGSFLEFVILSKTGKVWRTPLELVPGWRNYALPFRELGISSADIPQIEKVGFENPSATDQIFLIDEFLIRE